MSDDSAFAAAIHAARTERGMSPEEVAAAAGWTPGQLLDAERDRYAPSPDQLWRLAVVLGLDPEGLARLALDEPTR